MRNTNPEGLYSIKGNKFEALDLPVIQEQRGKDYIKFGLDNLFPQTLIGLYDSSAMNHTCIDAIKDGIYGEGIKDYGSEYINSEGETIDDRVGNRSEFASAVCRESGFHGVNLAQRSLIIGRNLL